MLEKYKNVHIVYSKERVNILHAMIVFIRSATAENEMESMRNLFSGILAMATELMFDEARCDYLTNDESMEYMQFLLTTPGHDELIARHIQEFADSIREYRELENKINWSED